MSTDLASVLAAAETLSIAERCELIDRLIDGLDESALSDTENESQDLSEAWRQEVVQRSAEYDAGRAKTVPWEDVQAKWQARRVAGG